MGKRIGQTTEEYIRQAATPVYNHPYCVIPHGDIIDSARGLLNAAGLSIEKELYSANLDANITRGIYHLGSGADPELQMIFAWVNSYDKSKRFSCAIGAHVTDSGYWLSGDMSSFRRKHTGTAKAEAIQAMEEQITNAGKYYTSLVSSKEQMKLVVLPEKLRAEILGRLLFKERLLTMEQAGIIKSLLMMSEDDSLWGLNKMISRAMLKSHPRDWMEVSLKTSEFLNKEFGIGQAVAIPNQVNLISSIAEIEAEKKEPETSFEL